jgi:hypothetical protein
MYLLQYHLLSRFQISHIMSNIEFKCDVTEFDCIPQTENDVNVFSINEKSLIINLMNDDDILVQTEISKADACRLAKLILLVYEKM